MVQTFQEAIDEIFSFELKKDYSLDTMRLAMRLLENPLDNIQLIHIAGTNGKGSVSQMMFSILQHAWKKVWMYTQPHIHDIRERCVINSELMSEEEFIDIVNTILNLGLNLSYFEKTTLISFEYFKRKKVEYAVIEVGVWGLLDSTNIIEPTITCITSIGLDHQFLLGNTIEEISAQKAGIIKSWVPIVYNTRNNIIHEAAKYLWVKEIFTQRKEKTNLIGLHQEYNAGLAYEISNYLWISHKIIWEWLTQVKHRGRLEYMSHNLLIDGAHNEQSMQSLKVYIWEIEASYKKIILCVSLKKWKSVELFLNTFWENYEFIILNIQKEIIEDAQVLQKEFQDFGIKTQILGVTQVLGWAKKNTETLYVIFWSLYSLPFLLNRRNIQHISDYNV